MTAKRKRRARKSPSHIARRLRGIVQTPLRLAFDCLPGYRLNGAWHREAASMSEVAGRLANGRASIDIVRAWLNGRRRAPAWFVAVLQAELADRLLQIERCQQALRDYQPVNPEARKAARQAAGRRLRMRQLGRPLRGETTGEAINEDAPQKNEPHN